MLFLLSGPVNFSIGARFLFVSFASIISSLFLVSIPAASAAAINSCMRFTTGFSDGLFGTNVSFNYWGICTHIPENILKKTRWLLATRYKACNTLIVKKLSFSTHRMPSVSDHKEQPSYGFYREAELSKL